MNVKTTVNLSIKQVIAGVVAAFLLGGILVAGGVAIVMAKRPVSEPASVASPSAVSTTQPADRPAEADSKATEIVPGTGSEPGQNATAYQCKANYKTVQVPIGQTIQADGAKYVLTETRNEPHQVSVALSITLPAGVSAPSIVVNGADHRTRPDIWSNSVLEVALKPGGAGNYMLATDAYVKNYDTTGITDVVICTKIK